MELYEQVGSVMYKKRCAACFFLRDDQGEPSLDELAARAGVKQVSVEDPPGSGRMWWPDHWGGIDGVVLCLERRPKHYLFEIQFIMFDLWHLERDRKDERELPLEEERYYPLVLAFRDACRALDPDMAIVTYAEHQDHRWVRERIEHYMCNFDTDVLVRESGLIYLDDALFYWWDEHNNPALPHDRVPTERGALLFAGQGRRRWV